MRRICGGRAFVPAFLQVSSGMGFTYIAKFLFVYAISVTQWNSGAELQKNRNKTVHAQILWIGEKIS